MSLQQAREAVQAGVDAESALRLIARIRRPTEEETNKARDAYALAAEGARVLDAAGEVHQ